MNTLYHITKEEHLDSILRDGIVPSLGRDCDSGLSRSITHSEVFLTTDPLTVLNMGRCKLWIDNDIAVLLIIDANSVDHRRYVLSGKETEKVCSYVSPTSIVDYIKLSNWIKCNK